MSITDELRKWWVRKFPIMDKELHKDFTAIADRIDAEHERVEQDLIDANNQMEQLCECSVELPKDADGEYIHVGDEMCGYGWPNGGVYCRAIVNEVTILVGPQDGAYRGWLMWAANECRHYHAPTVEDVLREFADLVRKERVELATIGEDAIAEYASKLRLAEGEDA